MIIGIRNRNAAPLLLLGLLLAAARPASASDLELVETGGVAPNAVILADNSGSMRNHLWNDDFNPEVLYPETCWDPHTIDNSSCPGHGNPDEECPDNAAFVNLDDSDAPSMELKCHGDKRIVYIDPDLPKTRYAENYLNWLFGVATATDLVDESHETRDAVMKSVLTAVVNQINPDSPDGGYEERIRFGLAQFDMNDGGYLRVPIASGNKANLLNKIGQIYPNMNTPLSETLIDIGRYYAGSHRLGSFQQYKYDTHGDYTNSPPPSPVDLWCRKNFVLIVTDGEPTADRNLHWAAAFSTTIGNADLDGNECSLDFPAVCTDDPRGGRDDGVVYRYSDGTDWLDDVAYYLHRTDLDPDLQGAQNVITYTIGFVIDHPLLSEAAENGGGSYASTRMGAELADYLEEMLLEIIERSYSFTAASVPAARTTFGDGLYSAWFTPSPEEPVWKGHLEAFRLRTNGIVEDSHGNPALDPATGIFSETRVPFWDAGLLLQSNTARSLYTTVSGARADFDTPTITEPMLGVHPGEIPLYPNFPDSGVNTLPELRDAVVLYLHGRDTFDEDEDGDSTEMRPTVLGDIFHSTPVAVGYPTTLLKKEEGFGVSSSGTTFLERYAQRDRVVYAGANDGMLHAFEAGQFHTGDNPKTADVVENGYYDMGTGAERFGYVPGMQLGRVKMIPRNAPRTYYYVDATPAVADAWLGDPSDPDDITKSAEEWATVLVVGMREGGAGYLALDVTDPDDTIGLGPHGPYPKLLWEFDSSQSAHLGQTWSEPVITRVKVEGPQGLGDRCGREDGDGDCREEWVAIFGGGYTEEGNPNSAAYSAASLAGKAIFMVELDSGELLGSVEYDPMGLSGPDNMNYAIPSSPAVLDLNFDGFADVVYIGDLGGQVWKWDLSQVGVDSDADTEMDNWPAGLFFQAPTATTGKGVTRYKSIFFPPSGTLVKGEVLLGFATGEREELNYRGDPTADENNRIYVVKDPLPTGAGALASTYYESDLTDMTGFDQDPNPTDLGSFTVARDGEKFITNHTIYNGFFITASFVPTSSVADPCEGVSGESFLYIQDVTTGEGYFFDAGVSTGDSSRRISIGAGVPSDPRIVVSGDGQNQLYVKTSPGRIFQMTPPPVTYPPFTTIYWKQNF